MRLQVLLILPIALAVREWAAIEDDLDEPKLDKLGAMTQSVLKALNHDAPVQITFDDEPWVNIAPRFSIWTAIPMTQNKGDLVISGGVYNIVKLLESRDMPISCPVLWAQNRWEAYLSVTKEAQKGGQVLFGAVTKGVVDIADIGHLKTVLDKMIGVPGFTNPVQGLSAALKQGEALASLRSAAFAPARPGENSTFDQVSKAIYGAKLQWQRVQNTKRVVRFMLGPHYTESGAYDLQMSCMQPDPDRSAYVYVPHPDPDAPPVQLRTPMLAGFILAIS